VEVFYSNIAQNVTHEFFAPFIVRRNLLERHSSEQASQTTLEVQTVHLCAQQQPAEKAQAFLCALPKRPHQQ